MGGTPHAGTRNGYAVRPGVLDLQKVCRDFPVTVLETPTLQYPIPSYPLWNRLLSDYPQLAQISLNDETPTANPETQAWSQELKNFQVQPFAQELAPVLAMRACRAAEQTATRFLRSGKQAASSGHPQDAIAILEREGSTRTVGPWPVPATSAISPSLHGCRNIGRSSPHSGRLLAREIDGSQAPIDWEDPDLVIHALGPTVSMHGQA